MIQRTRVIIGLMGGGEQAPDARDIGRRIAEAGHILLTGAAIGNETSRRIHRAAMHAAMHAAALTGQARLIGILPGGQAGFTRVSVGRGFYLHTAMESVERDSITGLTPDALIFFRGSAGTLCELAYAAAAGRTTYFVDSVDCLRERLSDPAPAAEIQETFEKAHRRCGEIDGRQTNVEELKQIPAQRLASSQNWNGTLSQLVAHALETTIAGGLRPQTGFPPSINDSWKQQFEANVLKLE